MFAYCLNNPVVLVDASGTAAQICFGYDGQQDESPWKIGSPGGGGLPQDIHYSQQDYGSVADKFYIVRAAQFAGNKIAHSVNLLSDAYAQSYKMLQEAQLREAELIAEVSPRIRKAGRTGGTEAVISGLVETAIIYFVGGMEPRIALISIGAFYAGGYVEGVYKEIVLIFEENY